jgi:hypothetical protein
VWSRFHLMRNLENEDDSPQRTQVGRAVTDQKKLTTEDTESTEKKTERGIRGAGAVGRPHPPSSSR